MDTLDFYFPMLVFFYGTIMVIVTHSRTLEEIAHKRLDSALVEQFYGHRLLGRICFFVGFFWTLQRLYIS